MEMSELMFVEKEEQIIQEFVFLLQIKFQMKRKL